MGRKKPITPLTEQQRELAEQHIDLVHSIACSDRFKHIPVAKEDLISFGWIGLLQAAQRFDPARGLSFSTLASKRIIGSILDELRNINGGPRIRKGRKPLPFHVYYMPDWGEEHKGIDVPAPVTNPLIRLEVEDALSKFPQRTQSILRMYYLQGMPLKEIAPHIGVSDSRVCQILRDAVALDSV